MRYLVISPCVDARTGKEFAAGDEFLPEPDTAQAERLIKAGCLDFIPDGAPLLPGTDHADAVVVDLRDQLARANDTIIGLNERVGQLTAANDDLAEAGKNIAAKLEAARNELIAATGDLNTLRAERDQLEQQVKDLTDSLKGEDGPAEPAAAKPAKQRS
ncbi:hypothetical protein CA236_01260 [Sphingomonas sp. ABOLG]|uniref:hypothetical protein n=1 Tax=Sphingomonas sp. ABOLG TaxID=1985880 RepID=UPI000F7F47CB|nr:hypothetical protein [Sphingomonas sp. ABOLG]RSV20553.1 hypothetical protein CA236_01260 [Sphingomonas sp. ABOLG]